MIGIEKRPPMLEDLRSHTPEQLAELRLLLNAGITGRPDFRRPGFYELDGMTTSTTFSVIPRATKFCCLRRGKGSSIRSQRWSATTARPHDHRGIDPLVHAWKTAVAPARGSALFFLQLQRHGIDAIAQSPGLRAVIKHVPQVRITTAARYFRPDHAVRSIRVSPPTALQGPSEHRSWASHSPSEIWSRNGKAVAHNRRTCRCRAFPWIRTRR